MTYQNFKKVVDLMISQTKRINALYKLGIDSYSTFDEHDRIVNALWKEILTEEGNDWLSWYLYEKDGITGKPKSFMTANDEDGTEICKNIKGVYEYLVKYEYFKK